ncbi:MAG: hypothetical protein HY776_02350 [Actinobacteria bacterium]|nr:hypothetical protein [Actinomycetota bacterium]
MKRYDFILIILTIIVLVSIGLVSVYGTVYSYMLSASNSNWTSTWLYQEYLNKMNYYAYPFVVSLIILLGLCIPKRIFPRRILIWTSILLVLILIVLGLLIDYSFSLGFLLIVSMIIQLVVIVELFLKSKLLNFEKEGFFAQMGSSLLHLGFIVFVYDFVLLQESSLHLAIFWISTFLLTIGMIFSFYNKELGRNFKKNKAPCSR